MNTEPKTSSLSLNGTKFFAIRPNKSDDVPAVEHDYTTGKFAVLIFSSEESAKMYCYHRDISNADIVELSRRKNVPVESTGLLRIARLLDKDYKYIEFFVFDHPGKSGPANFVKVKDVLRAGVKSTKSKSLMDFLANHLDPDGNDIWSQ